MERIGASFVQAELYGFLRYNIFLLFTDLHALYCAPGREVLCASHGLESPDPQVVGLALRQASDHF